MDTQVGTGGDLAHRGRDIHRRMKIDFYKRAADDRLRFNPLDVIYRGSKLALESRDDSMFHLERRQAAILPSYYNYGDVDFREYIDGSTQNDQRTDEQYDQREYDKCVRPVQGQSYDPHDGSSETRAAIHTPIVEFREGATIIILHSF